MNSLRLLIGSLVIVFQLTHASFPYGGYYGGYPADGYYGLLNPYPYASFGYGVHPYAYPYSMHSHYYHPSTAIRNIAKSFHREDGHLSATSLVSPFAKVHKKI